MANGAVSPPRPLSTTFTVARGRPAGTATVNDVGVDDNGELLSPPNQTVSTNSRPLPVMIRLSPATASEGASTTSGWITRVVAALVMKSPGATWPQVPEMSSSGCIDVRWRALQTSS